MKITRSEVALMTFDLLDSLAPAPNATSVQYNIQCSISH